VMSGWFSRKILSVFMCDIPCILVYNCYNFPTHAQLLENYSNYSLSYSIIIVIVYYRYQ
jgi:hypothetical protein